MKRARRIAAALLIGAFLAWAGRQVMHDECVAQAIPRKGANAVSQFRGKTNAPDFPKTLEWLNTDRPISLKDLHGKVVVLDFWTFCCINCMHVLPDLEKLEHKYRNELVVIGVHSAKFSAERQTENIRQAILRYGIEHPVVNDRAMIVWRSYAVRAWPTLFVIDPEGKIVGYTSGEGIYEPFDELIARIIKEFDRQGKIDRRPMRSKLEREKVRPGPLSFPGKVLSDGKSKRLFIADSNHNRIVVATLDGEVKRIIGTGAKGLRDGAFDEAQFNHPQGMALDGDVLYVADTGNHAVRRIDLEAGKVTTLAGTGRQARGSPRMGTTERGGPLNSPWDLVLHDGKLYVAMAGPHQLWAIDPSTGAAGVYAGSGREARIDGTLRDAALAQPSGITTDGRRLYFADSETSSVRAADLGQTGMSVLLEGKGRVATIVGEDLFEFGDRDGTGAAVRLQHPLGIVWHQGVLYVADTYNNKIKVIDPAKKSSTSFLGTGEAGLRDGTSARFDEPDGLSVASGKLYIADTNNHAIRVADLNTKKVTTLKLADLKPPVPMPTPVVIGEPDLALAPQRVRPGKATLVLSATLPDGYKFAVGAPAQVVLAIEGGTFEDGTRRKRIGAAAFPATVPIELTKGDVRIKAAFSLYYCRTKGNGLCYFQETVVEARVVSSDNAKANEVRIDYTLTP